jgi:hypothetical protein
MHIFGLKSKLYDSFIFIFQNIFKFRKQNEKEEKKWKIFIFFTYLNIFWLQIAKSHQKYLFPIPSENDFFYFFFIINSESKKENWKSIADFLSTIYILIYFNMFCFSY